MGDYLSPKPWYWHLYYSIKYSKDWSCGYEYWEGKPKWCISADYYDGWHWCIHIGKFYLSASYY